MIIKKTTIKSYEVYNCLKWQMTVKYTIAERARRGLRTKGLDKCFICGKGFKGDDFPYLALIRNHNNEFICVNCAELVMKEDRDGVHLAGSRIRNCKAHKPISEVKKREKNNTAGI